MEKEKYLETKEFAYEVLLEHFLSDDSFEHGTNDLFDELVNPTDCELLYYFVATALFQLERNGLEKRVKEQMTYWIYQYKQGVFHDLIPDKELIEEDIKKIESMITLKFEDLECYEADN